MSLTAFSGIVAAFEESAGIDILLKCSGFIDLAVYYEGYLAAQNGERDEDSKEEQYKELIQAQGSVLGEDDVQVPVDSSARKKITVPLSDPIDGLNLESSID